MVAVPRVFSGAGIGGISSGPLDGSLGDKKVDVGASGPLAELKICGLNGE
ncbi:hypothetical protein PHLCEN_2v3602 [Hermanssonia centrifuga]|uniref:Uncharacterized protein n=1 Tax=Hermanssonia centrifuga TaxID=98765 RepID=A0A2R6QEN1_9APHY|nr:hypothetical protein PHLCEN_2v3602 [Hermanssonia centrifuga]